MVFLRSSRSIVAVKTAPHLLTHTDTLSHLIKILDMFFHPEIIWSLWRLEFKPIFMSYEKKD